MLDNQVDAIRQRAAAATPGPWHAGGRGCPLHSIHPWEVVISGKQPLIDLPQGEQGTRDAAFIAHARKDIPDLLAEIDRLNAALANTAPSPCPYGRHENGKHYAGAAGWQPCSANDQE